ncbi:MAG TPA: LLM class flavin-dependent oxidoreductase [Candidatus Binataceae bacterium]|nr:LLM class flavin-dependent oxidoreductase [Candidatus Binataceae bacterium]
MRLTIPAGFTFKNGKLDIDLVLEAERLGYHSAWTAETWGADAATPLAYMAAHTTRIKLGTGIMQMGARSPAMVAMTAMTLDALSGGRFLLGLGPSGPQVIEGWHGVPYGNPVRRTREHIEIIRQILAREAPVEYHGKEYELPYSGPGASGLGKPLRSILHGRPDLPIYTAATIGQQALELAGRLADGTKPMWMSPYQPNVELVAGPIRRGFEKGSRHKSFDTFDLSPNVFVVLGADIAKCLMPVKQFLSFYIGGMGARSKNFYVNYAHLMGYGEAAERSRTCSSAASATRRSARCPTSSPTRSRWSVLKSESSIGCRRGRSRRSARCRFDRAASMRSA